MLTESFQGRYTTLNEKDVWNLSPTMQSRPVFIKFSSITYVLCLLSDLDTHLRIFQWNKVALASLESQFSWPHVRATFSRLSDETSENNTHSLDFALTFVSVIFNYAGPFFLKWAATPRLWFAIYVTFHRRILDLIGLKEPTPESRTRAYIYAFLAFVCSVGKAQADVQHLWFGRRGASRMRSELMASIYDKALKRKDFSGIVSKDNKAEATKEPASNGVETKESKRRSHLLPLFGCILWASIRSSQSKEKAR